jgi:hypothetical protein
MPKGRIIALAIVLLLAIAIALGVGFFVASLPDGIRQIVLGGIAAVAALLAIIRYRHHKRHIAEVQKSKALEHLKHAPPPPSRPPHSAATDSYDPIAGQPGIRPPIASSFEYKRRRPLVPVNGTVDESAVYWDEAPFPTYFLKRMWRIAIPWLIFAGSVYGFYNVKDSGIDTRWALGVVVIGLFAVWYTIRRYLKWKLLRLRIKGAWFQIVQLGNRFFLIKDDIQEIPIDTCNNIKKTKTMFEFLLFLRCGSLSIDSQIDTEDNFKTLRSVRYHEDLATLIKELYSVVRHVPFPVPRSNKSK